MKNKYLKFLSIAMAVGMISSMAFACGRDPIDSGNSTQEGSVNIRVLNFEGGVGAAWLDDAIQRFESAYINKEFASGLKGINVMPQTIAKGGADVLAQIKNDSFNVYFTEEVYYNDFISQNVLADITDIVTQDLTAYGEDRSIEDKMNNNVKKYLNISDKYYAVPFWEGYSVIVYDRDVFEQKGLFYKTDGTFVDPNSFTDGVYTGLGTLSNGPDGKAGTVDDGLPATYDEFFALCDYMSAGPSITPFVWPGAHQDYMNEFANQLWADYEGYDRMLMNFTFEGEDDSLVDTVDANGKITFKTKTNIGDNISLLNRQAGRYYAIDFVSRIMKDLSKYAVSNIMSGTMSHYDCADLFLKGKYYSQLSTIGMMVNGVWWQNEALDTFAELEFEKGEEASLQNRRLGILPLPKATEKEVGKERTLQVQKSAFAFVNGNIEDNEVLEAAKLFLQFCCTNESLSNFQRITGLSWGLDYTMSETELAKCSYYSKETYNIHKNSTLVYPYSKHETYVTKTSLIMSNKTPWTTSFDDKTAAIITTAFYNNPTLTAKKYFDGLQNLF